MIGGGLLQTCVLRPSGIYGPEERRHLHRVMVRPLIPLFHFHTLSSFTVSLSDLSQIPDSCTLQAQLCQCAQSCTILMESVRGSCYSMCFCCACTYRHIAVCASAVTLHANIFLFVLLLSPHTDTFLCVLLVSFYIQKHGFVPVVTLHTNMSVCAYTDTCVAVLLRVISTQLILYSTHPQLRPRYTQS